MLVLKQGNIDAFIRKLNSIKLSATGTPGKTNLVINNTNTTETITFPAVISTAGNSAEAALMAIGASGSNNITANAGFLIGRESLSAAAGTLSIVSPAKKISSGSLTITAGTTLVISNADVLTLDGIYGELYYENSKSDEPIRSIKVTSFFGEASIVTRLIIQVLNLNEQMYKEKFLRYHHVIKYNNSVDKDKLFCDVSLYTDEQLALLYEFLHDNKVSNDVCSELKQVIRPREKTEKEQQFQRDLTKLDPESFSQLLKIAEEICAAVITSNALYSLAQACENSRMLTEAYEAYAAIPESNCYYGTALAQRVSMRLENIDFQDKSDEEKHKLLEENLHEFFEEFSENLDDINFIPLAIKLVEYAGLPFWKFRERCRNPDFKNLLMKEFSKLAFELKWENDLLKKGNTEKSDTASLEIPGVIFLEPLPAKDFFNLYLKLANVIFLLQRENKFLREESKPVLKFTIPQEQLTVLQEKLTAILQEQQITPLGDHSANDPDPTFLPLAESAREKSEEDSFKERKPNEFSKARVSSAF